MYNVTGKYLLNTEDALLCDTCSNDPAFENTKAYYVAEAYAGAIAQNLRANIWFSVLGEWLRHNGLLDITTSGYPPLPAYYAYQFGAQELDGASYVGKITNFPAVAGYEFSKSDRHIWLMWVPDGSNVTVDLRATPLAIFHVNGDPVTISGEQLVLGREPYYVELPQSLPRLHLPILSLNAYASIPNGDFEEGQSAWIFANNGLPVSLVSTNQLDPNTPAGKYSVLLGNPDYPCLGVPIGYAEVSGTVLVPTHPNEKVWLDFDYIIYSQDALSGTGAFDRFEVNVLGSADPAFFDGNLFNQNLKACQYRRVPGPENLRENMTTGWAHGSLDLSKYQGQVITIYFRNYNRPDNFYNTYTILDNIRIR